MIHTHTVVIKNAGNKAANNVRVMHHVLPPFSIHSPVTTTRQKGASQSEAILIPVLVPKDEIVISYLYAANLKWHEIHAYVKCDEGMAKSTDMMMVPQPSKATVALVWGLIFVGVSTLTYIAIELFLWWAADSGSSGLSL